MSENFSDRLIRAVSSAKSEQEEGYYHLVGGSIHVPEVGITAKITRIVAISVNGQGAEVPWVDVYAIDNKGGVEYLATSVNLAHADEVIYHRPAVKNG